MHFRIELVMLWKYNSVIEDGWLVFNSCIEATSDCGDFLSKEGSESISKLSGAGIIVVPNIL